MFDAVRPGKGGIIPGAEKPENKGKRETGETGGTGETGETGETGLSFLIGAGRLVDRIGEIMQTAGRRLSTVVLSMAGGGDFE